MKLSNRTIFFFGIITFLILGGLSLFYYKERAFFLDLSYILYKIIETDDLAIQVNRYVSLFTQGVAYTGLKLNLSLQTIAQLYSLSFVAFQFIIFLIILRILKSKWIALGLLLFNILLVRHTFYWTASELIQGMAILFLFVAALQKAFHSDGKSRYVFHGLALFCLVTTAFAHPLLNIPLAYTTLFFFLKYPKGRIISVSYLLAIVLVYAIKHFYFSNYYDQSHMKGLANFVKFFPNYYTSSMEKFFGWLYKEYYFFLGTSIIVLLYYIRKIQILRFTLVSLFLISYCLLINVSYPKDAYQFYLESQYLPLSFFVILPLVIDILPHLQEKKWIAPLLSILILVSLIRIEVAHTRYSFRLDWNREFMNKNMEAGRDKMILLDKELHKPTLMLTWAMAYEYWIMSTIEKSKTMSVVAIRNEEQFDKSLDWTDVFLTMWTNSDHKNLNKDYFKFEDGSRLYKKYSMKEINDGIVK